MNTEKIKNWFKKEWHLPKNNKIKEIIESFSLTEKVIFYIFVIIFASSTILMLYKVSDNFLVEVPDYGGSLTEGVLGSPRFINPLLAVSDIDKDLSTLVYSGLTKIDVDGTIVPDLAESYTISTDGLVYTFVLKEAYFHDGKKITADDVIYTIEKTVDPLLKSPREANWVGVKAEKIDDRTVSFNLRQPYSPFIQNTTLGILPKHIWNNITTEEFPFSQFNTKPIGSGPYKIDSISYTGSGFPSEYKLSSFSKYSLGKPYINTITIKSYKTEKDLIEAYKGGKIESFHTISKEYLKDVDEKATNIELATLPRVFGLFFNQNVAPVFIHKEVRSALDTALDKNLILDTILAGLGQTIQSPIPPAVVSQKIDKITAEEKIEKARNILTTKGWKLNSSGVFEKKEGNKVTKLSFSISTGNAEELKQSAEIMKENWERLGAEVELKVFEIGDLNQNVIKTRKYDSLLFGTVVGKDLDLYPFWHSSGRNSPGLNIAMYTNLRVDKLLENIRNTTDKDEKNSYLEKLDLEIQNDIPAVFTYSPYFTYAVPKKIHNIELHTLGNPSERWSNVSKWYIETNKVWKIFLK